MRGKGFEITLKISLTGITPEHAGKSSRSIEWKCFERDHPRTCGEKLVKLSLYIKLTGSPPHMRGKVKAYNKQTGATRITPAHAGKRM